MSRRVAARIFGLAALALLLPAAAGSKQQQLSAQDAAHTFAGPGRCQGCHFQAVGLYKTSGVESFTLLTEAKTWTEVDRHALACNHVDPQQSELAAQIYKNLQIANYETEWMNQRQCLSCHANWLPEQKERPPFYTSGVSCESCHGPSSAWDQPHSQTAWRKTDPAEKKKLGMVAVRHPVARAEQCFSCHIGDASEQKVVTHEMYAAGHPPLPNIEIESFARRMPRHWRYLPEKGNFEHRGEFVKLHYGSAEAEQDLPRAKAVVVGGAVALRFYLELLASQTADAAGQIRWPEFAAYDCSGCHHDLKSPSWRQLRDENNHGMPQMLEWPTLLAERVSLPLLNDPQTSAEFEQHMQTMRKLLTQRPFGPPPGDGAAALPAAAQAFAAFLKLQETKLADMRYGEETAHKTLDALTAAGKDRLLDFYSARQLAAAYRTVQLELDTPYPPLEEAGTTPAEKAEKYLAQFNDWKCGKLAEQSTLMDEQLERAMLLKELSLMPVMAPLQLSGGCKVDDSPLQPAAMNEAIRRERRNMLERAAMYDGRWFRDRFGQLRAMPGVKVGR